jgi:hypothetical protein
MTLDGISSTECLSNDPLDDGRCTNRRVSELKDEEPLNDDGGSQIALNLSMSVFDSCPFSASSTKIGMA